MNVTVLDIEFEYNGTMQIINPVVLQDNDFLILVDAGYPKQRIQFEESAKQHGIQLEKLTHIILTHHDFDHIGSLAEFKRNYPSVKIVASEIEKEYIEKRKKPLRLQQAEKVYPSLLDKDKPKALIFHKILESIEEVKVDEIVTDHQLLPIGDGIEVIFTPGHTEGHISLYLKESKILISGDALFLDEQQLKIPHPEFAYDVEMAKASIKKLFNYEIDQIICYHGGLLKGNWKEAMSFEN